MSLGAAQLGVPVDTWLSAPAGFLEVVEVVDGVLVIKKVGGNPHHIIARRLADEFERQWDVVATAPGNWAVEMAPDGSVVRGRIPDVLVNGPELFTEDVHVGVPVAAVEVWSPSNMLREMNEKRAEYRNAGLPVLLEAFLSDSGDVHLDWMVNLRSHWSTVAASEGDTILDVPALSGVHEAFAVVPNTLLRR
ncbi:Uma2 family endonuclease [Kineococcus sp. SYSU DK003]|uniref:Uma2 family endonuclease n=1 Tax=Kineococcus sp. SYSU DK003 TaxID=3383124 RepID=UPI003D7DD9C2